MSTYRQSAKDYSNNLRLRKTRQMPNVFETRRNIPVYQEVTQPNDQNISSESAQIRNKTKELNNDQDADTIDQNSFTKSETNGKAQASLKSTTSAVATTTSVELKSSFAKVWTTVSSINIPALQYEQKSSFTPSAIAYMETLHVMETILDGNEELRWQSPNYFSLPVRLYYCVLFYVQVYRAKETAGKITKSESSWLRAFNRRFKDVSMPVAGPMVPILSNISAILPDDSQFNYVYPDLPNQGTYLTKPNETKDATTLTTKSAHFIVPSITLVADMLRQFCKSRGKLSNDNFNELGEYVPFKLSEGGILGGIILQPLTN